MTGTAPEPHRYVGGNPGLDFVNSVDRWVDGEPRDDRLRSYGDLIAWGEGGGLLDRRLARRLEAAAAKRPRDAARVLARARALRRTLHRLFAAIAAGRRPAAVDLDAFNAALARTVPPQRVVAGPHGFQWAWDDSPALDRVLWPVLRGAAELLTSDRLARVRQCGGERCGWLFLDETKNRSRRWCEMSVCGNRAKARRHYRRRRAMAATGPEDASRPQAAGPKVKRRSRRA